MLHREPASAKMVNSETSSAKKAMQPTIIRRQMSDWGTTYGPVGEGPFPCLMILHGSEGGMSEWSHRTAAILAASGFLCYPHRYSKGDNGWNAGQIEDVEIGRTVEALAALRRFAPGSGKVGVYGVSRGAEHALLLASLMAKDGMDDLPEAVACLAAPDVICGAFDARSFRDSGDPGWQPWDPSRRAWKWNGCSDALLPSSPIEIERYPGPLFLAVGLDDRMWSPDMTRRLENRRRAAGRHVEAHYYNGEGHVPGSEGENLHHARLLSFLQQNLFV